MMALTLSVPVADWLTPWENTVTTRRVSVNHSPERRYITRLEAGRCGLPGRGSSLSRCSSAASIPDVLAAMNSPSSAFRSASACSKPTNNAVSPSGLIGKMKVRLVRGGCSRGSIEYDPHAGAVGLGLDDALVEDRVAPAEVGADKDQKIG